MIYGAIYHELQPRAESYRVIPMAKIPYFENGFNMIGASTLASLISDDESDETMLICVADVY